MNWRKCFDPSYTIIEIDLEPGEELYAEPGAFIMGSGNYEVELTLSSSKEEGLFTSILNAAQRKIAGGESAFFVRYRAIDRTTLFLGPGDSEPGDIIYVPVQSGIIVKSGKYVAHYGDIQTSIALVYAGYFQVSGDVTWLNLIGNGGAWISGKGGLLRIDLAPGQTVYVDEEHIVGFSQDIRYDIKLFSDIYGKDKGVIDFVKKAAKALATTHFSREGVIFRFTGPGSVIIQTR
ncbi:MAG TPA: AIM24 family protein [Candidatus Nanopusillus sp.]|nr:AIM24 family protein [Candidatus Nanopusillus sp.]HIP90002.1 AIM24 family protein [Candidatus Nanopusillus sp.]